MVRAEPTPLLLGLCIYGWMKGYLSLCLNMVSECRFSSKFKCLETAELNNYVHMSPNHAYPNGTSKDGMTSNGLTEKESEIWREFNPQCTARRVTRAMPELLVELEKRIKQMH
jgi:hypothetical protein